MDSLVPSFKQYLRNYHYGVLLLIGGDIYQSNPRALELLGYRNSSDLMNFSFVDLLVDKNDAGFHVIQRCVLGQEVLLQYPALLKKHDGEEFKAMISVTPATLENELVSFVFISPAENKSTIEQALEVLNKGVTSDQFHHFLVQCISALTSLYGAKYGFVGKLIQPEQKQVETLIVMAGGKVVDNFTYDLEGTPCQDVLDHNKELIPRDAAKIYSEDALLVQMGVESYFGVPLLVDDQLIGLVSIMDDKPMELTPTVRPVLGVFAARIAMEVNNKLEHDALERQVNLRTSEMKRAMHEAERANHAKTDFLSNMSHELRTPLNAILGFAQLLEMDLKSREYDDALSNIEEIVSAGDHLLELINEILDMHRIEEGKLKLLNEVVNLSVLIGEVINLLQPLADRGSIRIDSGCPDNVAVMADRFRLKQVMINFLSNAIKYNHQGGHVEVECAPLGDKRLRVKVVDSGRGIPDEKKDRLFLPFERLEQSDYGVEGAGIGLALSKRLVELMGGEVGFESVDGQGSIFWFDINAACDAAEKQEDPVISEVVIPEKIYTVLYVEDNPANMRLLSRALSKHRPDIEVLTTNDGSSGIDIAKSHRPDLVFLDIGLPGLNGFDVLTLLRENESTENIPVIAVSANAMTADIKAGLDAGFNDYVTKPLKIPAFIDLVGNYLPRKSE